MEADIILRLLLFIALLAMSGFFSGSETALFSLGPVQIMRLEEEHHPRVGLLKRLLAQPRRLIATIFIGNEFVNVGSSALMASVIDRGLHQQGRLVVTVVSTAISVLLILMFGELLPKNIAARTSESWALRSTRPIALLAFVMAPLRWSIERIADFVVRLVGSGRPEDQLAKVGEAEFRTMVDVVSKEGELNQRETNFIHNIFELGERRVGTVMTPAARVFALSVELSLPEVLDQVRGNIYSRVPIFDGTRDRIIGIVHAKDLVAIAHRLGKQPRRLRDILHPAYFVPRTTVCDQLFREFRRRRTHMALVVDEYGRFAGLVTMEDLLEEMFGEIVDEKEVPADEGLR
ncbi:MAG: HlyC/CorC family transporter [Deltaproteobacteria bacterium]|nr:HlyC/CorC family transporter [Deltaproteobacteria bacterium]